MKMKKKINLDFVAIIIGVLTAFVGIGILIGQTTFPKEHYYPLTTIVTTINEDYDTVSVEDSNGFIWQFSGVEDWGEGDICSIIMDSKGTNTILDDEIVKTRYCGNTSFFEGR